MNIKKYEASYEGDQRANKQYKVYRVLHDKAWHCRCEYEHVGTTQIAGSGGIKGLRNGTKKRDGLEIESENRFCNTCNTITRQDRWTGGFIEAIPVGSFPAKFSEKVFKIFNYKDVVEMTKRPSSHLTIDHKLPRLRWDTKAEKFQNNYTGMTEQDIRKHFQLLKKSNGAVSHNLLKSRACEKCYKTGRRGTPFNIRFFYKGDVLWEPSNKKESSGCIGCGWYDFAKWRNSLNKCIDEIIKIKSELKNETK